MPLTHVATRTLRSLSTLIVGFSLACSEPATEYHGSATTDAVSDSAASLRIVFWTRTDTSFSGYLVAGAPAEIHGSAYGWHERSALKIATVSTGSDTIIWTSHKSDDEIGGRFEIVGGPRAGQEGTWRAQLAKGSAASPETLRTPTFGSLALRVVAALLLTLVIGAAASRWVWRDPVPPEPEVDSFATNPLIGVSGWLALFVIGQSIIVVTRALAMPEALASLGGASWDLGTLAPALRPMLVIEAAFHVLQVVGPIGGVYLVAKHNRYAPRFWFAYLIVAIALVLLDLAVMPLVSARLELALSYTPDWNREMNQALRENARGLIGMLVWTLYWIKSQRVKATFGSNPLDRGGATVSPPLTTVPASPAEQPAAEPS
jgi:hypothetical protein